MIYFVVIIIDELLLLCVCVCLCVLRTFLLFSRLNFLNRHIIEQNMNFENNKLSN